MCFRVKINKCSYLWLWMPRFARESFQNVWGKYVNQGKGWKDLDKCFISSHKGVSRGQISTDRFCYSHVAHRRTAGSRLRLSFIAGFSPLKYLIFVFIKGVTDVSVIFVEWFLFAYNVYKLPPGQLCLTFVKGSLGRFLSFDVPMFYFFP